MKTTAVFAILLSFGSFTIAYAQSTSSPPYLAMAPSEQYYIHERQDEIALARTAAPPSISADADVLVLGKQGYETAVRGKNGFVCFVERSWTAGFDDPEFWNPKIRAPNCFNPPAAHSVLPEYLKRTEWALAHATKKEIIEKTRAAYASHQFTTPEAGSFSFMLSKQGYLNDITAGPWMPHVMPFVAHGQAVAWAAGLEGSPIMGADGGPIGPTVLLIPVRQWSDGSPAPPFTEHHH
jgi:hypothetical protein